MGKKLYLQIYLILYLTYEFFFVYITYIKLITYSRFTVQTLKNHNVHVFHFFKDEIVANQKQQ